MKIKGILKFIIVLLLSSILLVLAGGILIINQNKTTSRLEENVTFSVQKGQSLVQIAEHLETENLIRSSFLLRLICKIFRTEKIIKAGYYHIPAGATTIDIHNILISGEEKLIKITIPEGWTIHKIAKYLEEKQITKQQEFLTMTGSPELLAIYGIPAKNFEGYLFPDTYYFSEGLQPEIIINKMVSNFFTKLLEIVPDYAQYDNQTIFDKLIMASIIEREYRVEEEAVLIASVFYNRLKYQVGLESCATLEYIITDILGRPHPEYITLADKAIDSLYNTYKWHGLPPGPISNPGKVALRAAFYPARTDYWFFVVKDLNTGRHYFSKEFEEHINAKLYYLKGYGNLPD